MKKLIAGLWFPGLCFLSMAAAAQTADSARWHAEAAQVTVVRDDWGIAHIHGSTDADAVFGMIYAQCEDDFNRVERNYLTALGRTAEADGEAGIWQDLRQRLFIDPAELKKDYEVSPEWLKKLMNAWADGINFYLVTHPGTKPEVITLFEPWMALSFTEGSIGGDIERVNLKELKAFYAGPHSLVRTISPGSAHTSQVTPVLVEEDAGLGLLTHDGEPRGSNGFAISPANTSTHHALLLINPHTSFFFRSELQVSSDEGLNAYGAVTWGQFFVYQGFNDHAGWMHTSSGVDAVDEYRETIEHGTYRYGAEHRPLTQKTITLRYRTPEGTKTQTFTTYATTHGPVIREEAGKWVTIQLMNTPGPALEQSYLRTKSTNYATYKKIMELQGNSSNNTIFADADGDIAYWHGNFIPIRDTRFDFTKPQDGSNPATDWHGLMTVDAIPQLKNPASGYLFNVNDSPWNGAGASSLKKADFPAYVEQGIESARGLHAMRVLDPHGVARNDFTLETLMDAAYDSYLPWFERTLPRLFAAWDRLDANAPMKAVLKDQIALLRPWDKRWGADSKATSLAVFWGTDLLRTNAAAAREDLLPSEEYIVANVSDNALLAALKHASDKLEADFGTWHIAWGEINRFQRLNDQIAPTFHDDQASIPVPFTSATWGSLASFGARQYPGTKKWYGTSGNSFVAVVEFGPKVRAKAVTAGGESGDPKSKHFNDEAGRYAAGKLRDIYFYPEQLKGHTERTYHPGESD